QRGTQQHVFTGKARREAEPVAPALQRGELGLEGAARRVGAARVLVAVPQLPDAILHEGGGLIDRLDDGAGRGVRGEAGGDGARTEVKVLGHARLPSWVAW